MLERAGLQDRNRIRGSAGVLRTVWVLYLIKQLDSSIMVHSVDYETGRPATVVIVVWNLQWKKMSSFKSAVSEEERN